MSNLRSAPSTSPSSSSQASNATPVNRYESSPAPPTHNFPQFPSLIPELRLHIYESAITPRFIIFRYHASSQAHMAAPTISIPPFLRASREAQVEGLKHYIELSAVPAKPNHPVRIILAPDHDTVMSFTWDPVSRMNSSTVATLRAAVELGGYKKLAVGQTEMIWLARNLNVWRRLLVRAPQLDTIVVVWENRHRMSERIGVLVDVEGGVNHQSVPWDMRAYLQGIVDVNGLVNGSAGKPQFLFGHIELEQNM